MVLRSINVELMVYLKFMNSFNIIFQGVYGRVSKNVIITITNYRLPFCFAVLLDGLGLPSTYRMLVVVE